MTESIEYPPVPIEEETRAEWERRALNPWRQMMKAKIVARRGPTCERPGCDATGVMDLDEGILPRCDMRGLDLERRRLAFGSPNLFLVCPSCNRENAHRRMEMFEVACRIHGDGAVREWYNGIGLKAPDRRFT